MYRVRYYDQTYHPDHFKGGGWLGLLIRVMNWYRWKLETAIQRLVLRFLAKRGGVQKERFRGLRETFELDVRAEKIEKEMTSPLREPMEVDASVTRAERYVEGRQSTVIEDAVALEQTGELPTRPTRLDAMIARYGTNTRARRYSRGKRYTVIDPEGDFVPVEDEGDGGPGHVGVGSGGGERIGGGDDRARDLEVVESSSGTPRQGQGARRGAR